MNEVVAPGAFDGAILDFYAGKSRARFLWNHDSSQPPIGKILAMKTLTRSQLPRQLIDSDPDVTGALQITKQYFTDPFAERVYQGVIAGAITEMSFAYDVKLSRLEERDGKNIRILETLEVYDVADVNWGANSRTIARVTSPKGTRPPYRRASNPSPGAFLADAKARAFALSLGTPAADQMMLDMKLDLARASALAALMRPGRR